MDYGKSLRKIWGENLLKQSYCLAIRESFINPKEPSGALKQPTFFPNSDSFCQWPIFSKTVFFNK